MKNAVIFSTGSYLPETAVQNEELSAFPASSLGLIVEKTGIRSRRIAPEEACTSDLALEAARKCLQRIEFPAEKLQGIVLSTSSPDRMQPATATRVQHKLGAANAFAFDINSVCSGSTFGICMADALIQSGKFENILFIASEMYSKILHKEDFSTFPFFGDGAGAILFRAEDSRRGVCHSCLGTDGSGSEVISVPAGGTMTPFERLKRRRMAYFKMNGPAVFEFAIRKGAEVILQLLGEAGVGPEEIDWFILHQANINIIKAIAARLGVSVEKFIVNLDRYANTASASVLVALDEAISDRRIGAGDLVVTCAFGGGLSWGANLIRI